jgi:hypothetical protein
MKFLARVPGRRKIVIEAPTFFDARAHAQRALGAEELEVTHAAENARADVELRWVGSDAGVRPGRHMQARTRVKGRLTKWQRV